MKVTQATRLDVEGTSGSMQGVIRRRHPENDAFLPPRQLDE